MAQNVKDLDATYESQRKKIEKLMENPDKLVDIPERDQSSKQTHQPPDFVRNVMSSSAGAGSGVFHVYRHLRRKEMARLKEMEKNATEEELDALYKVQLEKKKELAEQITARKRAKRIKKKTKLRDKRHELKAKLGNKELTE